MKQVLGRCTRAFFVIDTILLNWGLAMYGDRLQLVLNSDLQSRPSSS